LETGGNLNKFASEETRKYQSQSRKKYYETDKGMAFKVQHGKFMSEFNSINNDRKKIERFSDKNIIKIQISNVPSENTVYLFVYCEGSCKQHRIRIKYHTLQSVFDRIKHIISSISKQHTKINNSIIGLY
jgi:hypothetical protein